MAAWGVHGPTWAPRRHLTASDNIVPHDPTSHTNNNNAVYIHLGFAVGSYAGGVLAGYNRNIVLQ